MKKYENLFFPCSRCLVATDALYVALRRRGEFWILHWFSLSAFLCCICRKSRRNVFNLENLSVVLQAAGRRKFGENNSWFWNSFETTGWKWTWAHLGCWPLTVFSRLRLWAGLVLLQFCWKEPLSHCSSSWQCLTKWLVTYSDALTINISYKSDTTTFREVRGQNKGKCTLQPQTLAGLLFEQPSYVLLGRALWQSVDYTGVLRGGDLES